MKRVLVISSRCFSTTDSNGQTLLHLIEGIPKEEVSQLYFYENLPSIKGYNYFQLSDKDILRGLFNKNKRGRKVEVEEDVIEDTITIEKKYHIKRTVLLLWIRYFIWKTSWLSPQIVKWLDDINPDVIFFMAGDGLHTYKICDWVKERYNGLLYTYVTDDYILKRKKENFFEILYRKKVFKHLKKTAHESEELFTICERMRAKYNEVLLKDSKILVNSCKPLYDGGTYNLEKGKDIVFLYAGGLYYGRDKLLLELSKALDKINEDSDESTGMASLHIYSNQKPEDEFIDELSTTYSGKYKSSLNEDELIRKLNLCDYPVFVESFDLENFERSRLSFSTKILQYLSLKKCILAIGPRNTGSMDILEKVAVCVNDESKIYATVKKMLENIDCLDSKANDAYSEYIRLSSLPTLKEYLEDLKNED